MKYDFKSIESRWQQRWADDKTYRTPNPGDADFDADRPKFFTMDMFPYPSGVGLHVGHPLGFIATDIVARYKAMQGFNVLHPMGFDAFGLPAEQYAVETGVHPRITTEKNIANMTAQLQRLGMGYDWDRSFATTDPDYVNWTQWIFLQLFHSYYDPLEDKTLPISELVRKLQGEDYYVGIDGELIYSGITEDLEAIGGIGNPGVHKWHELTQDQQRRLLDEYRLAFMAEVEVNWCPGLGTVLANEEVTNDGRSERGNFPVFKRPLKQWMLRITAYAQRLIDDLDLVDWPESIKLLQRNWIGKSTGAEVDFAVKPDPERSEGPDASPELIRVFTTRPDTLFGATYMVLAPEHELVSQITTEDQRGDVEAYVKQASEKTSVDRQADKEKTGVFTGAYAVNPVNGEQIPIWIADYVMMGYGTGAIMAVPAHDERDFEFAKKFDLPIRCVVMPPDDSYFDKNHAQTIGQMDRYKELRSAGNDYSESKQQAFDEFYDVALTRPFTGEGISINSHVANDGKVPVLSISGKGTVKAKEAITRALERRVLGKATTQFKLRDWLFSRQRYWGEPFPILHGPGGEVRAVDEADLPVELPEMEDFKPHGSDDPDAPPSPPLGRAPGSWREVEIDGVIYTRELNTMPNWAGSCWYYLRYIDPRNADRLVGEEAEKYWMLSEKASGGHHAGGVDLYIGGVEHAVLHLLYARFWHKVLFDLGHVSTPEPFGKLFSQGYIQAYCYRDERGMAVPAAEVVNADGRPAAEVQGKPGEKFTYQGEPVTEEYGKMGKGLKNAVAPDDVCVQYGADTLRLFEMCLGPLDQSKPWNPTDIVGVHRFLQRLWRNLVNDETGDLLVEEAPPEKALLRLTHKTIKRVTEAMDGMAFNVAIAALIELNNALVQRDTVPRWVAEAMVTMLAPFAPHIAEELWERLGHDGSVTRAAWPTWDDDLLVEDTVEMPVQVNGKMRGKVTVPADADDAAIESAARADDNVATHLEGKTIRKVIVIKGRLINIVAN